MVGLGTGISRTVVDRAADKRRKALRCSRRGWRNCALSELSGLPRAVDVARRGLTPCLGSPTEARNYLAEAAQLVETTDERIFEAELLHRVPGDLLNAAGDRSGAERHYRQAIAVAERQSAKLFQLRASTSLARLWRDQGKRTEAHDLLAPIYGWFTEGFDAPDPEGREGAAG